MIGRVNDNISESLEADLVGYWPLSEEFDANDLSGNNNNGAINGAVWSDEGPELNSTTVSGTQYSLLWHSSIDLSNDIDNPDIILKITPTDADPGESLLVSGLDVDLNDPPSIALDPIPGEQSANITINYSISDTNMDVIDLVCEYKELNGNIWQPATVLGAINNITDYDSSLTWFSLYDLGDEARGYYYFRITPYDNDPGVIGNVLIYIDNEDLPPGANVAIAQGEQSDTVDVQLVLISPDIQPEQLSTEYSTDKGSTWLDATMVNPEEFEDGSLIHSTYWLSSSDLPEVDRDSMLFRFYYLSEESGLSANYISNYFSIDNNTPPTVTIAEMFGEYSDTIAFTYDLADIADDTLSLVIDYTIDGGITWNDATVIDPIDNILSSDYSGIFRWNSAFDTEGIDAEELFSFRVTPMDEDFGIASLTSFHLDNNRLPVVMIDSIKQEVSSEVAIDFFFEDPESDSLDYIYEYSIDSAKTWNTATVTEMEQTNGDSQRVSTQFGLNIHTRESGSQLLSSTERQFKNS